MREMHPNTLSLLRLTTLMLHCRQHEAELRHSREECWAQEQELAAVREKLAHLKATLDDRRKDLVGYKVRTFSFCWKMVITISQYINNFTINKCWQTFTALHCSRSCQSCFATHLG